MTELSNLISAAVAAKMTPEFIEKEVDARVGKLITEAIDVALRSYSDTGKLVTEAVQNALRVDHLDLPHYGSTVCAILKTQIEATVAPLVAGRLAEDMEHLLSLAPKTIKLSKIADEMRDSWRHEDDYGPCITVEVERTQYDNAWVYLDESTHFEHGAQSNAEIQLLVSKDGTISSASIRKRTLNDTHHLGRDYGLAQRIRAYVACGTVIELDEDCVSVSRGDY